MSLDERVYAIHRPEPQLLTFYVLFSLLLGPLFFVALIPLYFRYHTMHYDFDEEGISMRWGILFRREITLTYARIQDIHLTSNIVERWLGLAKIQIQTASGSSDAEMTIEGIRDYAAVRDFLYTRMRGSHRPSAQKSAAAALADSSAAALREVAAELHEVRGLLAEVLGGRTR